MPIRALWRSSPAWWLTPVLVVLVGYHLSAAYPWGFDPTWLAASSRVTAGLFLAATAAAGCAAWDAGRQRRARIATWAPARSRIGILVGTATPAICLGLIGLATAAATVLPSTVGTPGLPDARPLLFAALATTAAALLGTALGWLTSPYVALPAAMVGTYLWHVYPPAIEPLWVRQLTGFGWDGCCDVAMVPDGGLFWVSAAAPVGLVLGFLLLFLVRRLLLGVTLATLVIVLAVGSAVPLAVPLGGDPLVPRSGDMVCRAGTPTVCVWPESRQMLTRVATAAHDIASRLSAAGVPTPATVAEGYHRPAPHEWLFTARRDADDDRIRRNLVLGLLPPYPPCAAQDNWQGFPAQEVIWAWLWATAGGTGDDFPYPAQDDERTLLVARVRQLAAPDQLAWYRRNLAAVVTCDLPAQLEPAA